MGPDKKKGITVIIEKLRGKKEEPSVEESTEDVKVDSSQAKVLAAEDVISAIKENDAKALALSLENFMACCQDHEDDSDYSMSED
jgi:hypothetical protein